MQIQVDFSRADNRKYPEQIAIAIAKDKNGKYNPMTLSWTMATSFDPPLMAVSIGKERYTYEALKFSKEFVISYPSVNMKKELAFFGSTSGRGTDKLKESGCRYEKAKKIEGIILSNSVVNYECIKEMEVETGDHVIFIGRVVCTTMNDDEKINRIFSLRNGFFHL